MVTIYIIRQNLVCLFHCIMAYKFLLTGNLVTHAPLQTTREKLYWEPSVPNFISLGFYFLGYLIESDRCCLPVAWVWGPSHHVFHCGIECLLMVLER